jgi:hypothetical protein
VSATAVYKKCEVCGQSFPRGRETHYTCPDCSSKDYSDLVGKTMRTPFEPSGLVRVLRVEDELFNGKRTVFIEFTEDHPNGYRAGDVGRYFAHELKETA